MNDLIQRLRAHYPFAGLPREAADRIEVLEAALLEIAESARDPWQSICRAALAPEQDKSEDTSVEDAIEAIKEKHCK